MEDGKWKHVSKSAGAVPLRAGIDGATLQRMQDGKWKMENQRAFSGAQGADAHQQHSGRARVGQERLDESRGLGFGSESCCRARIALWTKKG